MTRAEAIEHLKNIAIYSFQDGYTDEARQALDMAIKALEEPQWIPCSKRLPKKSGRYYVSGGDEVWICEFLIIQNFTGGWCNNATNPVVQAWMSPPEPWRGDKNG